MFLQNEILSWRKFLLQFDGLTTIPIHDQRPEPSLVRPIWRLESTSDIANGLGGRDSNWMDERTIKVHYLATSLSDMYTMEKKIVEVLRRTKIVPGYLEDFEYPGPFLTAVADVGSTIDNTTVFIGVTGIDRSANETLLTEASIALVADEAVKVRVDRYPLSTPWFPTYNVYIGSATGQLKLHTSGLVQPVDKTWPEVTLNALAPGGNSPPTNSEVTFLNIMVDEDLSITRMEDPNTSGIWDVILSVSTRSLGIPVRPQDVPTLASVTEREVIG